MVLLTCPRCGIRFYAPDSDQHRTCWRCERDDRTEVDAIAERLLVEVFPQGLPAEL
jgi:hypothetical protein